MPATDARPVPLKGSAFRVYFEILDLLGDGVTSAAGLDSEVSKDGGAFADCTNEATEIGQGEYYLDLTSTEMNADAVVVIVKTSTTNAKTTRIKLYPQEADDIKASVTYWGTSAIATPDTAGHPKVTVKSGTGTGEISISSGVVSSNVSQCGGSAVAAGAIPNVAAGASGGLPLSVDASGRVDVLKINGTSQTGRDIGASVLLSSGTGTGQLDFTSGVVKSNLTQCGGSAVAAGAIPNAAAATSGGLITAGSGSGQLNPLSGKIAIATTDFTTIAQQVWNRTAGSESQGSYGDYATQVLTAATQDGVVVASASKTGYSLASGAITSAAIADGAITSAKFTVSSLTGVASGILEKMAQVWARFFGKVIHDMDAEQLKTYDGNTVLTTQSLVVDDDAQTETQGAAS